MAPDRKGEERREHREETDWDARGIGRREGETRGGGFLVDVFGRATRCIQRRSVARVVAVAKIGGETETEGGGVDEEAGEDGREREGAIDRERGAD